MNQYLARGIDCPQTMRPFLELRVESILEGTQVLLAGVDPDSYQNSSRKGKGSWMLGEPVVVGGIRKGVGLAWGKGGV